MLMMSKYREINDANYRGECDVPVGPPGIRKNLNLQNECSERIDSGFGDDNSLSLSIEDRSVTGSDSLSDKSRDQMCIKGDSLNSSNELQLVQKTQKCTISDRNDDSAYFSISDSGISIEKSMNSLRETSRPSFMNSFAQTSDIRYLLAPFWRGLLCPNQDGDTCLHLAIINCQTMVVDAIINVLPNKEYLNIYNDLIQTPLHLAVITRQAQIVEQLLDCGANVDLLDRNGQTCLHLACKRGDLKVIKAIFKPRPNDGQFNGKIQEVLRTRNFNGHTPLHIAVLESHLDVVKLLVCLGADVNVTDGKSGHTALHLAVEQNNLPMVSYLLFEGNAMVDSPSYSDCTPLHLASGLGLMSILATLIAAGANQTLENSEGETAYDVACDDVDGILECTFEPMED